MMAGDRIAPRPVFIESPAGRLFGVYFARVDTPGSRCATLYIPPFAEEMNRSRRMAALQARALAAMGIDTLLLDLFGTGDSEGDFRDASVPRWLDDIEAAADWLEAQARVVPCLWGLRLGALLACAAAARRPQRFRQLLLWQPVIDAKAMLTQFLRIRVATSMAEGGVLEKTEDLRALLSGGTSVEIAGYELSPELARALDELRMDRFDLAPGTRADWRDVAEEASDRILPGGERVVDGWRKAGISVSAATVSGDPFWTLQETTLAPALLAATTSILQTCPS